MKNLIRFPVERTPGKRLDVAIQRLERLHTWRRDLRAAMNFTDHVDRLRLPLPPRV